MSVQQHKQSPSKNQSDGRKRQPAPPSKNGAVQAAPDLQRALQDPSLASPGEILQLQKTAGNRAVSGMLTARKRSMPAGSERILRSPAPEEEELLQGKLRVGPVGDAYEQQADRMAEHVMRSPAPQIQRRGMPEEEELLQGKFRSPAPVVQRSGVPEEEELLQGKRRGGGGFTVDDQTRQEIGSQQGHGAPLPAPLRAEMEARFGADFGAVSVHADTRAAHLNKRLHARAFTHQADIYFDAGTYEPGSAEGKRLLAHELTHVVQQGAAAPQAKRAAPAQPQASARLASAPQSIQRDGDDEEEGMVDKVTGALGSTAVGTGSTMYENIINWTTQNPHKMGPDEWSDKTPQETQYTKMGGGIGAGLSGVKTVMDLGGVYSGGRDIHQARKIRQNPTANPTKKELAWKKEKGGAKTLSTGLLATTGDTLSTVSGGITAAGNTASTLASTAGGFGVGVSGIDLGRNLWGMGRSAHKARKLGGWTGKGGLVEEIGQKEQTLSGGKTNLDLAQSGNRNLKKVREMQSLGDIAKYAHKHKARTAGMKALGAVGAGLGVAGGIAALASNPVGWALAGAGAAVGLGIGAYKLGRGMWKRSHRRDKLSEAEKQLGITRPEQGLGKRFGKWITGKDIDERREAIRKHVGTGYKLPIVERALKTEKQRKAEKLTEHLTGSQTSTEGKSLAGRIGSVLGVTSDEGKVKQSRGWKFWQKKEDLGMQDVNTKEKKEELSELFARKLGSS